MAQSEQDRAFLHTTGGCYLVEFLDAENRTRAWAHGKPAKEAVATAKEEAKAFLATSVGVRLVDLRIRQFSSCPNSGATDDAILDMRIPLGANLEPSGLSGVEFIQGR